MRRTCVATAMTAASTARVSAASVIRGAAARTPAHACESRHVDEDGRRTAAREARVERLIADIIASIDRELRRHAAAAHERD